MLLSAMSFSGDPMLMRTPLPAPLRDLARRALAASGQGDVEKKLIDLEAEIAAGRSVVWAFGRSLIVTNSTEDELGRVGLFFHVVAGDLGECLRAAEIIERYARDSEAAFLRAHGRRGWERVLPKHGWEIRQRRAHGTIYQKDL